MKSEATSIAEDMSEDDIKVVSKLATALWFVEHYPELPDVGERSSAFEKVSKEYRVKATKVFRALKRKGVVLGLD